MSVTTVSAPGSDTIDYEAWAYLSRVVEGPSAYLNDHLASGKSASEIAHAIKNRSSWLGPGLLSATQSRFEWDRAKQDLTIIGDLDGRLVTPQDEEWPREQLDQAFGFARSGMSPHIRSYQDDAVAPHALWVRGALRLDQILSQSVAFVGTRAVSSYGREATQTLVQGLARHQWTIVSGGALGVDTVAHSEALNQAVPTVCVTACGLDRSYPSRNEQLFSAIAQRGALVTEYPPEVTPQRHRFLTRNRLVAALTLGTVVVEAAWRSGALNTLSWASGLGRVAMAVPGPITTVNSLGCHHRIRNHEAELITSADDIRALLSRMGEVDADAQYELDFAKSPVQSLSRNELRIYDALSQEPHTASTVAKEAGVTVALAVHLLVELEKKGLIERVKNQWQRKSI